MVNPTRLILIRHGETEWNVIGRYQGQADPPLNARGMDQAYQLVDAIRGAGLDVLISSPLQRSQQTAQVLADALNVPLHLESRLMEIHQGDWQERLRAEIAELYPDLFRRWETEPWQVTPPEGESLQQVQARVYAAVDDILAQHQGSCIGLVIHRIPIALIRMRYQGLAPDSVRTLDLPNTYWEEMPLDGIEL
jgi:probable phosphoglycerate mutase